MQGRITVHFEDQGQDFLKWVIENGIVVESDLQEWMWKGTRVHNTTIKPGDYLEVTLPKNKYISRLKYKVIKVDGPEPPKEGTDAPQV